MKKTKSIMMKLVSVFLVFSMVFSLFPGIAEVLAAVDPDEIGVRYERVRENGVTTNKLTIFAPPGTLFDNPKVKLGNVGFVAQIAMSDEDKIVIDDEDSLSELGLGGKIVILNKGTENITGTGIIFDISNVPSINGVSLNKVYVDEPLFISGTGLNNLLSTDVPVDVSKDYKLFIQETEYNLRDTAIVQAIGQNRIDLKKVIPPSNPKSHAIMLIKNLSVNGNRQIVSTLKDSISVVNKLSGIKVVKVDPNSGPQDKENIINIYGDEVTNNSNFDQFMKIYVKGKNGKADIMGTNLLPIKNSSGKIIGLKVKLPIYTDTAGIVDLMLTDEDGYSEYVIPNAFVFLNIGNSLTVEGITPNSKKETEIKPATITGRNIGYFDPASYDKVAGVTKTATDPGYGNITGFPQFNNPDIYKVMYTGTYDGKPVTIIRQISVFIDGAVKMSGTPEFEINKDKIVVNPANVNLNPNQPKKVDVTIKTTTTVLDSTDATINPYYTRVEEASIPEGFTYIPNELAPVLTSVSPEFGPSAEDLYMTIKGKDFEVLETGVGPTVKIGSRSIPASEIKVYDDLNRVVDGKKILVGTKLKFVLKGNSSLLSGAVDVVVINPSLGQGILPKSFTFKNSIRPSVNKPKIISLKEAYADLRGGAFSKEDVLITGENFDPSVPGSDRVIVTIDGEKAVIKKNVSADGKTLTITPPPGTLPGKTMLQLINEDGSMAQMEFEYKLIITAPKITKIVPTKGGNGTKLVIKGEDFLLPDNGIANPDDPKRKGTVVLLGGKELNAYNYQFANGAYSITDPADNPDRGIYFYGNFDPDGAAGPLAPYLLDGKMVTVVDSTTIYVDIPDRFYSLNQNGVAPYLNSELIDAIDLTVQVLNPDGARSKENIMFEYLKPGSKPTILSMTPVSGTIAGGTVVRITGTNFKNDDMDGLKVYFGSELATKVDYINTTELIVQVPAYPYSLPQGKDNIDVPVMVMNYDGAMAVYKPGFKYRIPGSKPTITKLDPARGSAAGGEKVIISGSDFRRKPDNSDKPTVYFNGIEAQVEWVSDLTLIATAPPSKKEGPVDVVVVNHDAGAYTFKSYTYEISKPAITSVIPGVIAKNGGTKLQINGTSFTKGDLKSLLRLPDNPAGTEQYEKVNRHTSTPANAYTQIDNLVIFGDASTGDRKVIDTVRGPLSTDINELRVKYDARGYVNSALVGIYKINGDTDTLIRELVIPFGSAHLFIVNGKLDLGDDKLVDEGVLVEVTPNQAIVTRRVAAYAKWENDGRQITAVAPAVGSINKRNMYVRNTDNGTASTTIEVLNPSSEPTITYISPRNKVKLANGTISNYSDESSTDLEYYTYTPLDGGAFITINGTDFRRNVKVYMGNKLLEIVSRSLNDNQLVVKVPKGTLEDLDKLYRILVINEDGATADSSAISKPHYIVYKMPESNPIIESVTPANTSSKGQNTLIIKGTDFREGAKVLIDGIPCASVALDSYSKLVVKVPLGLTPGKKTIQVMNPDFGFAEKKDAINIVSSPKIDTVYDVKKNLPLNPIVFSIDGGQTIKLNGGDFLDGARVIIGGTLKAKADLKEGEAGIPCYNIYDAEMVIVGGVAAANVKIENSTTLTFTTPKLKVGDASVIVVNSDGGVSNVINGNYQKPIPDSPSYITIEVVDSDTIKLEWSEIAGSNHYELYAAYSKDGSYINNYIYVGSVKAYEVSEGRLRYFVDGLKASSWYSFKIKSVNDYGPSSFSPSTAFVKTKDKKITDFYKVPGEYQSGLAQTDKVSTLGNSLIVTVGEKSLGNYGSGLVVYFNQTSYSAFNSKSANIGLEILRKYPNNKITVIDKDFTLKMVSNNLLVNETAAVPIAKVSDSMMSIVINYNLKAKGDEILRKLPKGYKAVTKPVGISLSMQVEKTKVNIKGLNGSADLSFNISNDVKKRYPGGLYIAYYNNTTRKLEILMAQNLGTILTARTSKPGEYMLIGKFVR
ncbi:MAG: hypothetical protein K0S75_1788 [Clostridia bacterium]|nr:hypothetical protein [Clostridia bacterium]